jgi:isoquinoline 1-oxidoreductase alpha subunit
MALSLTINDQAVAVDADPSTPLLWVLRDHLGMTGTKFGCGIAQCGACTVHINDRAMRSCQFPLESAVGTRIRTIAAGRRHTRRQDMVAGSLPLKRRNPATVFA